MKLSVTIITLNEEANINRAITSVLFADEIIVVDSGSTDATPDIARSLGAQVVIHPFVGFGQQKNYAESLCQGQWILNIDADEEVSLSLKNSILSTINQDQNSVQAIYQMPRLTYFCQKPIFHGGWYPDLKARLYQKGKASWTTPHVHEDLIPFNSSSGLEVVGILEGDLLHYSFPTVKSQILTNVKYASLGAKEFIKRKKRRPYLWEILTRPLGKFVECYLIKRGFLDGLAGFIIAINASHSLFMKYTFAYYKE